jgi:hypothetical protein
MVAGQTAGLEEVRSARRNVPSGSKADIRVHPRDVRFTPESGH